MNQIKRSVKTQLFLMAMVLILAACGQRGPLYLPEPKQTPLEKKNTETVNTEANKAEVKKTQDDGKKSPTS